MILLLALLFLFRQYGTSAAPVTASFAEPSAYSATLFIRDDPTDACPGRSVWDIVWSCLATTFAVTWVSVHPNMPFLEESSWHLLKRRIFLMCLALLAPEVMVMWAFKQWRGAVMIMEILNNAPRPKSCPIKWTMTHGHFLQMGGFKVIYLENEDFFCSQKYTYSTIKKGFEVQESFLDFEKLRELLNKQLIDFPETTAKEIEDRSKSDALSKGVALLQISWFLLQLIAHVHQHLAITEIELTTAALAGLNSIMYLFWWNKPFDVRFPIVIRTKELEKRFAGAVREDIGRTDDSAGGTVELTKWWFPVNKDGHMDFDLTSHLVGQALSTINTTLDRVFLTLIFFPYAFSIAIRPSAASNKNTEEFIVRRSPKWIWMFCKFAVTKLVYLPCLLMFFPVHAILHPDCFESLSSFPDAKDKMDNAPSLRRLFDMSYMEWIMGMMFYSEPAETRLLLIFSALAGAAFGLIHCTAWNFDFPSTIEQILWRTSSLVIVFTCLCIIAAIPLYNFVCGKYLKAPGDSNSEMFWSIIMTTVRAALAIVYSLACIFLLILSLLSFRDLSPSALDTVTWTKSIPHI